MKWSWQLGRLAGIDVKVHATFFLLVAWIGMTYWLADHAIASVVSGVLFILLLFGCVVLHELGHALTARRFGVETRDIILLPIGGVARLDHIPEKPWQELRIAAAGPAVNVAIATGLYCWLRITGSWQPLSEMSMAGGPTPQKLAVLNVFLALFNLIPAFPMDGGRMLRAVLAMRFDYVRATRIAASIGQGLACVFGFLGLFANPLLIIIAFFVWIGASQEASLVTIKSALGGTPVGQVMLTEFHTLEPADPLERAVELTMSGSQQDFPVLSSRRGAEGGMESGQVVGVLTQADMLRGLAEQGTGVTVASAMQRDFQLADASEMIEPVFRRLQECACRTVPVLADGRLVGLVTLENVGEFLSIKSALRR